jgi:hypothetical protein
MVANKSFEKVAKFKNFGAKNGPELHSWGN